MVCLGRWACTLLLLVCVSVSLSVCVSVCMCVCVSVCLSVSLCISVCMCVCVSVCSGETALRDTLSQFETAYLSKSLSRLIDPINLVFSSSSASPPTDEEIDGIVKVISRSLSHSLIQTVRQSGCLTLLEIYWFSSWKSWKSTKSPGNFLVWFPSSHVYR